MPAPQSPTRASQPSPACPEAASALAHGLLPVRHDQDDVRAESSSAAASRSWPPYALPGNNTASGPSHTQTGIAHSAQTESQTPGALPANAPIWKRLGPPGAQWAENRQRRRADAAAQRQNGAPEEC